MLNYSKVSLSYIACHVDRPPIAAVSSVVLFTHALMCRLFENTFQLDVLSARDFCEADDRWAKAVQVSDNIGKAGWELLAAMLNLNWRLRPTAQSCLVHRFLTMN